jgi:hypothetical protein
VELGVIEQDDRLRVDDLAFFDHGDCLVQCGLNHFDVFAFLDEAAAWTDPVFRRIACNEEGQFLHEFAGAHESLKKAHRRGFEPKARFFLQFFDDAGFRCFAFQLAGAGFDQMAFPAAEIERQSELPHQHDPPACRIVKQDDSAMARIENLARDRLGFAVGPNAF